MAHRGKGETAVGWAVYRRLLGYLHGQRKLFVVGLASNIAFAAATASFAWMMKRFVEVLESGGSGMELALVPLLLLGIATLRSLMGFLGNYCMGRAGVAILHHLRCMLVDGLLRLPVAWYNDSDSGRLLSRLTYDTSRAAQAITGSVALAVQQSAQLLFITLYLLYLSWPLTLAFLLMVPMLSFISRAGRRLRRAGRDMQHSMGMVTHIAQEIIQGQRLVKSYGAAQYERDRFAGASAHNRDRMIKMERIRALVVPLVHLAMAVLMSAIMYLILLFNDSGSAATAVSYLVAAGMMPGTVRALSSVYVQLQQMAVAAESVFNLADQPGEPDRGTRRLRRARGHLQCRNLGFAYGVGGQVLQGIDFEVAPGQMVALVGRSGSGKSTLASLITRFYSPPPGTILLDGVAIEEYRLADLRAQIALVAQSQILFNDSVASNIAYGSMDRHSRAAVEQAAHKAHAHDFIEALPQGYDSRIGEGGILLSGGQKQRLAIARAILKDAPVLIMDEATSALDNESERHIKQSLAEMVQGRTTLVIAHRLSTVESADCILVLDGGRIVERGHHRELLARDGLYRHLHAEAHPGRG